MISKCFYCHFENANRERNIISNIHIHIDMCTFSENCSAYALCVVCSFAHFAHVFRAELCKLWMCWCVAYVSFELAYKKFVRFWIVIGRADARTHINECVYSLIQLKRKICIDSKHVRLLSLEKENFSHYTLCNELCSENIKRWMQLTEWIVGNCLNINTHMESVGRLRILI